MNESCSFEIKGHSSSGAVAFYSFFMSGEQLSQFLLWLLQWKDSFPNFSFVCNIGMYRFEYVRSFMVANEQAIVSVSMKTWRTEFYLTKGDVENILQNGVLMH